MYNLTKIALITTTLLITACATNFDVVIIQTQIDGLSGQISRTNDQIKAAVDSSNTALIASTRAAASANEAATIGEQTNQRVTALLAKMN